MTYKNNQTAVSASAGTACSPLLIPNHQTTMKINDIIKDNDPRVGHRLLVIEAFDGDEHVRARRILSDGTRKAYPKKGFRIKLTRIHTDGKKRKGGFSLENATGDMTKPDPDCPIQK